jgi:hypothetical protein
MLLGTAAQLYLQESPKFEYWVFYEPANKLDQCVLKRRIQWYLYQKVLTLYV